MSISDCLMHPPLGSISECLIGGRRWPAPQKCACRDSSTMTKLSAHRQNKSKDTFAFALQVRSRTWLHNKDPIAAPQRGRRMVWLPDLCRHVGRSGGERIPDAEKPKRRARFASREALIKLIEPHANDDRAGVIPICRPMPGFLA